jgi:hypothetical protein
VATNTTTSSEKQKGPRIKNCGIIYEPPQYNHKRKKLTVSIFRDDA